MVNMFSFVMTILKREKHMWRHAPFLCIYILKAKILTLQYIKEIFQRYSEKISFRALTQTVWAKNNVVVLTHLCIRSNADKLNNFVANMEKKTHPHLDWLWNIGSVHGVTVNKDIFFLGLTYSSDDTGESGLVSRLVNLQFTHVLQARVWHLTSGQHYWRLFTSQSDYIETCMYKNIDVHCWKQWGLDNTSKYW